MAELPPEFNRGVNIGGKGDVDMYTGPTYTAVSAIAKVGAAFGTAWGARIGAMEQAEGQLGKGPLGIQFGAAYNPVAASIKPGVKKVPETCNKYTAIGQKSVGIYLKADGVDVPAQFVPKE